MRWLTLPWLLAGCPTTGQIGDTVVIDDDQDGFEEEEDCDDHQPLAFPGNPELCDGIDNDCNGSVDENRVCLREDAFIQTSTLDFLFVIDNSPTMAEHQQAVATSLDDLLQWITGPEADTHIGAITMDMDSPTASGKLQGTASTRWIQSSTTPEQLEAWTQVAVLAGTSGSGSERGIDACIAALTDLSDTYNQGFRRDNAHLVVLTLSDETDQSEQELGDLLDLLPDVAPSATFHAIVPLGDPGCGDEQPFSPQIDLAAATGGTYLSICEPDYGPFLSAIGQFSRREGLSHRFPLTASVQPGSLSVEVTGPGGTTELLPDNQIGLSAEGTTLVLLGVPPVAGSRLIVRYQALPP